MSEQPTVAVIHFPSGGHIRPMVPLVAALGAAGMRTVQWAPAEWEGACAQAGGEFRPLPDLGDLAWPDPRPADIAAFLGGLAERLAPWACEQVGEVGADVVLRDSFAQYGHYAAREHGLEEFVVPAMMAFHSGIWPRSGVPRGIGEARAEVRSRRALSSASRALESRYGEPLGDALRVFAGRLGSPTFVMTVRSLQTQPEELQGEQIHYLGALRAIGQDEGGEEPALAGVQPGDQVVYVSLGTVFEQNPGFFAGAARALAAPGRRVILSIGRLDPAAIEPLPDGVLARAHVDQIAVLRRADLFVSHAGFNSMQEGLAAGVPMLLCPQMFEQAVNADQIVAQGAGLRVHDFSERQLASGVETILGEGTFRSEARRLADELRAGTSADPAVELLGAAAVRHHPT